VGQYSGHGQAMTGSLSCPIRCAPLIGEGTGANRVCSRSHLVSLPT
jgi:hypothetical protein